MGGELDWVGYDLYEVSRIYDRLNYKQKLKDIRNPQEFLSKFIGLFRDVTEPSEYVTRETHYALSNAGFNFSPENGFEGVTNLQYLQVRNRVLEGLVIQEINAVKKDPRAQAWWESVMGGLSRIFGEAYWERAEKVREIVEEY